MFLVVITSIDLKKNVNCTQNFFASLYFIHFKFQLKKLEKARKVTMLLVHTKT